MIAHPRLISGLMWLAMVSIIPFAPAAAAKRATADRHTIVPMTASRFWEIVKESQNSDQDAQASSLRRQLETLTPAEIVSWNMRLDQLMKASHRWDLWGAAFVAMGGASDDSFEYFRLWLISRGEGVFKKVLGDPDALVEFAPSDPEQLEFEDLAHIAPDVWSLKTGKRWDDMPNIPAFFDPSGYGPPAGVPFSEDAAALEAKYPRLSRRFGSGN